jgi:hypothetical protein
MVKPLEISSIGGNKGIIRGRSSTFENRDVFWCGNSTGCFLFKKNPAFRLVDAHAITRPPSWYRVDPPRVKGVTLQDSFSRQEQTFQGSVPAYSLVSIF